MFMLTTIAYSITINESIHLLYGYNASKWWYVSSWCETIVGIDNRNIVQSWIFTRSAIIIIHQNDYNIRILVMQMMVQVLKIMER